MMQRSLTWARSNVFRTKTPSDTIDHIVREAMERLGMGGTTNPQMR
jgi:hypothetical protein